MQLRLAFVVVFLISACGLGYQLVAGTVSSYLLGDSVTQFSFTIGLYLFALGIGSWLTKFIERDLVQRFIEIELAVAVAGGLSALCLMHAYASDLWFRPVLVLEILLVGTLVGIEIPLLVRILRDELDLRELLARVLAWDYVGALVVALAFPLVLVPRLGLVRSALALGLLNAAVALWSVSLFRARVRRPGALALQGAFVSLVLATVFGQAGRLTALAEHGFYANEVVHAETTPYQRVVLTRSKHDFQLFLNGALQFSSGDEYRYHEALVHPAMATAAEPRRVLILGGGDGLAVREVLRHTDVERVTLVDLDGAVTRLAREFPPLVALNAGSLSDPRVTVINADAMQFLAEDRGVYDVAIVDFPDPASFSVGKLYTQTFYERLVARMASDGAIAVQSTSPRQAPRSYWCIAATLESAGLFVRPYRCGVPSFGEWGFMLAAQREVPVPAKVPAGTRFLDAEFMRTLFVLPRDAARPEGIEPNRLSTQALVRSYEAELGGT
ncbi:MAG: polyamine aminopropyltransferase [Planctomycetota bacterium]